MTSLCRRWAIALRLESGKIYFYCEAPLLFTLIDILGVFSYASMRIGVLVYIADHSQGLLQLQAWVCLGFYTRAADFYE